jgi:hypothetical protein
MARPRIQINWEDFDKLCVMQATLTEIAAWFECSVDTIERAVKREKKMSFAEYFASKKGRGKISLRRRQYEVAMSGNVSMLIWLGKQYLDQSEKQQAEVNQNIVHEYIEVVPHLEDRTDIPDDLDDIQVDASHTAD